MMIKIRVNQVKVNRKHTIDEVVHKALKKAGTNRENLHRYEIVKKSIDARKSLMYVYSVQLELKKYQTNKLPKDIYLISNENTYQYPVPGKKKMKYRPVVVGFGPAGMFCAYMLAKAGYRPIVLERGKCVEERMKDVEAFWRDGTLNPESNVQFGEGGAGTFSDGKLNTGVKDKNGRQKFVLDTFVKMGAPMNITYDAKPHIGTDILQTIVRNMRKEIEANGGEVRFCSKVTKIEKNGIEYQIQINETEVLPAEICVLAIGHSARDTFEMLYENKFPMEQKPFAIGVRVEHKQSMINQSQYGVQTEKDIPAADYKLTFHSSKNRGVYSFCMCPGGYVVNASSEPGRCAVNGMSYSKRDGENANSAIVTTITPDDFAGEHPLAGMELQREIEERAFTEGQGVIPVQRYEDFVKNQKTKEFGSIKPNMKGSYHFGNIKKILPHEVCEAIEEAMPYFGTKIKGFDLGDTIFSAVESRTSSPVRILRDETLQSVYQGIYPCGEGAGYAGGITSAAMDGMKVFEAIAVEFAVD